MICFSVCTFHIHAQSGLIMHMLLVFFCVFLLSFFSLACTTLLTFVVCVVQLGEFQSH